MKIKDTYKIPATREKVWAALNDPEVLRQCIPGCQTLAMTSPATMSATAVLKVGPVKASFNGTVSLSDLDPPNGYTISGEGSGGMAGFAKGGARVRLEMAGNGETILHYDVESQIGGKLAQLGGRLIEAAARKVAAEFFGRFVAVVSAPAVAIGTDDTAEPRKVQERASECLA